MTTSRRGFLAGAAAAVGAATVRWPTPGAGSAADARVEVLLGEPIGTIAPEIYGHFVEHLGGVVYDGIWVGENSTIPNINGARKQLVEALAKINPPVIRWPGGCFADQYDWRDGTGPKATRPTRTNFWADDGSWPKGARKDGPQRFDPNAFGTADFARFCRNVGARPYLAANLRSLPAQDFWRWIEYANSPADSTTMARLRAADGSPEPFGIRYWGVGNESWGCGGNFTPEEYASEFRRFTAWAPNYGVDLAFVGSGPNGDDIDWTKRFFAAAKERGGLWAMWGWGLHHYAWKTNPTSKGDWWKDKSDALGFSLEQYYELLKDANRLESLITSHWTAMAEADPAHHVKLVVDEWGAWHAPGTEPFPESLFGQQSTMRDAVLAGLTLDTLNRHADKVAMANVAQLINCLQSLFFAHEHKFCVTPTYHVFDLFTPHMGAKAVRTVVSATESVPSLPDLSSSASVVDRQLTLTLTNTSAGLSRETRIGLRGGKPGNSRARSLFADNVHRRNSLAEPNAVAPRTLATTADGDGLTVILPPASVTCLTIRVD